MKLTDTKIRQAKPRDKDYKLSDGRGLFLLIKKNGSKYWRLKYRFAGKEKLLSIGVYPEITLKKARKATDEARELLEQGIDPSQHKQAVQAQRVEAHQNNFEMVAREWHQQQKIKWSEGYADKVLRAIERDLFPFIGSLSFDDIQPPLLLRAFRKVEGRGALDTAHRVKQLTGQIYRYAVATGRADRDITQDLTGALAPFKRQHFPAITEPEEVAKLLRMIDSYEGTITVRAALQLAPLVFVRPSELRKAEWSEIDFDSAEWRIPGEKMKMGVDHIIPLSTQAIEILKEQQLFSGNWQYVFPSARSPRRPMSDNAILSAFRNMGIPKEKMTAHGFRAMARTILDEVLGERVELIEHQLAHAVKDTLGRAYNRTTHLPQRREMMQRWADYLYELKD
ncbi:tyrosine-type recombinase/integrase [Neptuniibacter sp. QD37_6]|uniref:tyrosine-type recombinase/integrase n=1 Tax=Neptuniibacter sp. QD37_6 TaxID=3398210 RepID=UPI0039F51033